MHSAEALEALGLARLKEGLEALGLKAGGSLKDRAQRLFSAKALGGAPVPKKLLAGKAEAEGEDKRLALAEAQVASRRPRG